MANEIYDSTWWGNTIQTASSIGTSTEMIQGQFNLTKIGDEEVTNGDFATDSDWIKGTGWIISGGKANCDGSANFSDLTQNNTGIVIGKNYKITYTVSDYVSGSFKFIMNNNTASSSERNANGIYTDHISALSQAYSFRTQSSGFTGSIDNVSVKEVRATEVEASKCLADAIHRIGIQDIQN
jgi:hypothetical protein